MATTGMLTAEQAVQLKEAGLTAYNHNLGKTMVKMMMMTMVITLVLSPPPIRLHDVDDVDDGASSSPQTHRESTTRPSRPRGHTTTG